MSQNYNQPAAASDSLEDKRQKDVDAFDALLSLHSGSSEPSTTTAYMLWADTSSGWLKQCNSTDSAWIRLWKLEDLVGGGLPKCQAGWVSDSSTTWVGKQIPANHVVLRRSVEVTEAFDSDGTDLIRVGHDTDDDAYSQDVDVSAVGLKSLTDGVDIGEFSAAARTPQASYAAGGSAATTGKALVLVEYLLVPAAPA